MNRLNLLYALKTGDFSALAKAGPIKLMGNRLCFGTTVPTDGAAGYPFGAQFYDTDATTMATHKYVNIGSITSCNFDAAEIQNTNLALTTTPGGASYVGVFDTAGYYTGTTVEAVLAEIAAGMAWPGAQTMKAGAATAAVALRLGKTATEGLEIKVIDETIALTSAASTAFTAATCPAGGVWLSVQGNLEKTIVGDASGDDLLAKVGIGISSGKYKYGVSADLIKNTKIDTIPDWAVLSGSETLLLYGLKTDGTTACTEKFTVATASFRLRAVYLAPNSLDDAA